MSNENDIEATALGMLRSLVRSAQERAGAAEAEVVRWRTRTQYAEGEIGAALGLPSTMAPAPGELARVLRQAEKDRDAALQGVCPQGFVVVTLAEREMFAENARRLERANAENGELRAVLRDSLEALRTQIETLTAERDAVVTVVDTAKIHGARRSLADRVAVLASMFETVQSEARDAEAEAQSLRGSCASLTESIESAHAVAKAAGVPSGTVADQMAALVAKRDERRDEAVAIILGRDTGPTDAEIEAHAKSGGLWRALRVSVGVTTSMDVLDGIGARAIRDMAAHLGHGMTWWALDASGCPRAWPVVAAEVSHA